MRAVIYARYSSDKQNVASIDDQVRICQNLAEKNGYVVVDVLTDAALSGSDLNRPAVQTLLDNCHKYDVVICEAIDRLSRDQADMPTLFKHFEYQNVKIVSVNEGLINEMHIGLKGTMNAMFLKELANKTRRGLAGRVLKGKSGGGNSYGYDVINTINEDGTITKGDRAINKEQAKIVERIFYEYTELNYSAKTIAKKLNKDGIKSPSGGEWSASTISGNRRRGTGLINNELYVGKLVWNKLKYTRNPITKKRDSRLNSENEWVIAQVPDLRIIDNEVWQKTKNKLRTLSLLNGAEPKKRATYLLSDLIKCNSCGGGFSMINSSRYGCSTSRNKGTCDCRISIKRDQLEQTVLDFFKEELITDEFIDLFVKEYNSELESLNKNQKKHKTDRLHRKKELKKQQENLILSIKEGLPFNLAKDELSKIEAELNELEIITKEVQKNKIDNDGLASKYKNMIKSLSARELKQDALVTFRGLIEKIVLREINGVLGVDLYVDYRGLVPKKNRPVVSNRSDRVVAGAGFEPTTFGL
ncbi:recombinase family protein [Brumicola nitratireducens]|uniref:Recombinase n=1 Tax=Glaciecola nitratireducens (strain JCM 12485 / KCTC 12276 / FR1064) TaxID=1085623 RepID=G4QGQ6_GLANF|nr:Recombinase [Glaciecola nitratireducens FR1064]